MNDLCSASTAPDDEQTENEQNGPVADGREPGPVTRLGLRLGFYPGAPRRNSLIALVYLLGIVALLRLLGLA